MNHRGQVYSEEGLKQKPVREYFDIVRRAERLVKELKNKKGTHR